MLKLVSSLYRQGKRLVLSTASATGASRRLRDSEWRRRRLLILCYHGVSVADEHQWSDLYVSQEHLRKRFAHLRDAGYLVLPLSEALTGLDRGTLPRRSVSITFDDGAYDFLTKAYPLLREFGFSATLYQTTYYCGYQRPVFDTISSYLLWKGCGKRIELSPELGGSLQVPVGTAERNALHLAVRARANALGLTAAAKDEVARQMADQVGVDYSETLRTRFLHLMNAEEVASLDPGVVSVQLHTHRHRTPRNETMFLRELADNRAALEGMRPGVERLEHFCYPSGDYDPCFFPWLERSGVLSATTCVPGLAGPTTNRLLLPRLIDTMETPDEVFDGFLTGMAAFLPRGRS